MELILIILSTILFSIVVFLFENWMYGMSKKEESESKYVTRTKFPKQSIIASFVLLSISIIFFAASAVCLIIYEADLPLSVWIAFALTALCFISLCLFLTAYRFFTHEVIQEDGILVKRLAKTKFVPWAEMDSYSYSFNQIVVYDQNQKIIFYIAENRVGMQAVLDHLAAHNIPKR